MPSMMKKIPRAGAWFCDGNAAFLKTFDILLRWAHMIKHTSSFICPRGEMRQDKLEILYCLAVNHSKQPVAEDLHFFCIGLGFWNDKIPE